MSIICPSVTPSSPDPHAFREQIERVAAFAKRIQIDLMDGEFAPHKNINPIQVWWPDGIEADIHLMYKRPIEHVETLVSLQPACIILHAEADGDIAAQLTHIKRFGIKTGIALLQSTTPEHVRPLIELVDHVMIFAGHLGEFGGAADISLLAKVDGIKAINDQVEIGWDGGATIANVKQLARSGIDVINVGGSIQRADDPAEVYAELVAALV